MKLKLLLISGLSILMFGCADEMKEEEKDHRQSRTELLSQIDSLETIVLDNNIEPGSDAAALLLRNYTKYANLYPGDTENVPPFMFKAAGLSRGIQLPLKAIKLYDQILKDYPDYEKNPEVAFLLAFVYDEDLKEKELAKAEYRKVIEKFPGDYWAQQAEQRLANIDMTDEELIEMFMEKNKEQLQ